MQSSWTVDTEESVMTVHWICGRLAMSVTYVEWYHDIDIG